MKKYTSLLWTEAKCGQGWVSASETICQFIILSSHEIASSVLLHQVHKLCIQAQFLKKPYFFHLSNHSCWIGVTPFRIKTSQVNWTLTHDYKQENFKLFISTYFLLPTFVSNWKAFSLLEVHVLYLRDLNVLLHWSRSQPCLLVPISSGHFSPDPFTTKPIKRRRIPSITWLNSHYMFFRADSCQPEALWLFHRLSLFVVQTVVSVRWWK